MVSMSKEEPISEELQESMMVEALDAALDKKALNVVAIELTGLCSFTDHFIVCTGTSSRHNQTIGEGIDERLRSLGVRPLHIEGNKDGDWVLMDYGDFVVHVFTAKAREFYDLERLWRAGKRLDVEKLVEQLH